MPDIVINVEQLSKQYKISRTGRDERLRHAIQNAMVAPFRWLGERASRRARSGGESTESAAGFNALKDVSFDIERGEVVGIIGRNGAGKSTLLKILSRITEPTHGRVRIRGRVASLLEVGTGFHPELTGRENIFLNGAILGMSRKEIVRKLDEIVAFSGVEKFLNMPVKRYSSGMHVRLAFSVAAHLEPEILLVDEVLAVGDAEFQRKCLGKMRDVTRQGRTILFVSHNMAAIRNLCGRAILLERGSIAADGPVETVVTQYLHHDSSQSAVAAGDALERKIERSAWGATAADVLSCREIALLDVNGQPRDRFSSQEEITVAVTYASVASHHDFRIIVSIVDDENTKILTTQTADCEDNDTYGLAPGVYTSRCTIPANMFGEKRLHLSVWLVLPHVQILAVERALAFDVTFAGFNNIHYMASSESFLRPRLRWETDRLVGQETMALRAGGAVAR